MPARRGTTALHSPEIANPSAPAAGTRILYPKSDGNWYSKDSAGVETQVNGGGGGGTSGATYTVTTEYSSTTPAAPATGVTLFARRRARALPATIGPNGLDTALQPGLFTNRVSWWQMINNSTTVTAMGLAGPTGYATPTAVATATTNFFTSMVRLRYASAATANAFGGHRVPTAQWFLSSIANLGGFFWVFRFGVNQGNANSRAFVGLTATSAAEANSDSTALTNRIGFGFGTASTNWYFHSAGASTNATTTDLGANFPARTYATHFFEFRLFAPSGAGQQVFWSAQRLNDGVLVTGGPVTTNLPANGTLLTHQAWINNVTAAVASLDVQSLYIETDN